MGGPHPPGPLSNIWRGGLSTGWLILALLWPPAMQGTGAVVWSVMGRAWVVLLDHGVPGQLVGKQGRVLHVLGRFIE